MVGPSLGSGGRSERRPYDRNANAELRKGGAVGYARDGHRRSGRSNPSFVRARRRFYDWETAAWRS